MDELGGGGGGAPKSDPRVDVARTRETKQQRGGGMSRRRPDAVVAAASRLDGVASGRRKLASRTGKPSRPNELWISSARKTQGSGLRSSPWWAPKGPTNLARGRMARGN